MSNWLLASTVLVQLVVCCSASACKDIHGHCKHWAKNGDCTRPDWQDFMKRNCAKSCGFCSDQTPPEGKSSRPIMSDAAGRRTPGEAAALSDVTRNCVDLTENCHLWKQYGYCDRLRPYMRRMCSRTCQMCGSSVIGLEPAAFKAPVNNRCKDKSALCGTRYKESWCKQYKGFMSETCPKLCGAC